MGVIADVDEEDGLYDISFYKSKNKEYFLFDKSDTDTVGIECIKGKLPEPNFKQKLDEVYYYFDTSKYKNCTFQ